MSHYQHIFFDLDHTLWDFEQNSSATLRVLFDDFKLESLGIHSFEPFRAAYELHNEHFWERYRLGLIRRDDLRWKRMWHTLLDFKVADMALTKTMSMCYLELLPTQGRLVPHALDVLNECSARGQKLHLITNGFELTQWQKMRSSGIDRYFEQVVTSESSNCMKPQPEIFDFALKAAGAERAKSIMIGDALEADILGAQQFGIDQIYFNPRQKSHAAVPTYEISCLSQLSTLLS